MNRAAVTSATARIAAVAAALAAGAAMAQVRVPPPDDGPVIIGENRGKYVWWDLQRFTVALEFFGEFRYDKQEVQGQPTTTVRDDRIRATTNVSFESYIGHKNLIDLIGTVKLGYEDQTISSNVPGSDVHESPIADFYDLQALILAEGPAPLTAYSRRDETVTAREFSTSFRTNVTEHGAILSFRSDAAPTRLQYFHREQTITDSLSIDDSVTQDSFSLQSYIPLAEQQRLELNYTFDHIDESQSTGFQRVYDRHDATITHTWDFGSERRHNLRSSLRYYEQSGLFGQRDIRLDENLLLYHSDRFETRYNLSYDDQTIGDSEQRLLTGNASLRHKLFESLITTATAGGSHLENSGQFESDELFASYNLDYTKKVLMGRLDAAVGMGVNHQVNGDRGTNVIVINEPHTFNDPFDIIISRRNITSVVLVTNQTQTFTFQQGADYTVQYFPDRVELHREPFGPNPPANGQTVLVTYEVGPEPGSTIDTFSQSYSIRYTFDEGWLSGLSLYAYYLQTDHSLDALDSSLFVLDDVQDFRYGAEYRIGGLSLLAERRNHDSTVSPYDETRLEARYDRRLGRDSTLSLEATRNDITYRLNDERVELNRLTGRWTERLARGLDVSVYLQYRDEHNSINGDVTGFEQAVELRWQLRQTSIFGSFRNSVLTGDNTDRLSQTFTIGVTRTF